MGITESHLNWLQDRKNQFLLSYLAVYLIVGLVFAFSGGGYYTFNSLQKTRDLIEAKIWLPLSLLAAIAIHLATLNRARKLLLWVLTMSFYFVILYALLYKGTDFGLNGQWGDNGNRLALVTKFREFASPIQDWYFKNLPAFYPPLWFYISGKLAWIFGIEGYKTIKLGYFVIFSIYPFALYYVWTRISSRSIAFFITLLTVYFADVHLEWVYHEHITAAFFIPWWLYYIEDIDHKENKRLGWYITGGLFGALLFLTYYYWFFLGAMTVILRPLIRRLSGLGQYFKTTSLKHKIYVLIPAAILSSVFWLPLLLSILKFGGESMQSKWFHVGYLTYTMPFFDFTPIGLIYLLGIIYISIRYRRKISAFFTVLLLSIMALILIDRFANVMEFSMQTRKLRELLPVFMAVPSAYALVALYRFVSGHRRVLRRAALAVFTLLLLYIGNTHSDVLDDKMYQVGINNRVPTDDLAVFKAVDYRGKVFLTQRYLEAIYLPYYMFICPNAATAHTASRYNQRISMLQYLKTLQTPEQMAYLLKKNIFEAVDYFYLPLNPKNKTVYYELYPAYFPVKSVKLTLEFPTSLTSDSKYFVRRHAKGMYEVLNPPGPVTTIFSYDQSKIGFKELVNQYNRLNLAVAFLDRPTADSLKPTLNEAIRALKDSAKIDPIFEFGKIAALTDLKILPDTGGLSKLRIVFLPRQRPADDYRLFVHATPVDPTALSTGDKAKGFINLDFPETVASPRSEVGELQVLEKEVRLAPGKYRLQIGFYKAETGRLGKPYLSPPLDVNPSVVLKK